MIIFLKKWTSVSQSWLNCSPWLEHLLGSPVTFTKRKQGEEACRG